MHNYTVGPWSVTSSSGDVHSQARNGNNWICQGPNVNAPSAPGDIERSANAKIIAACPDLFEACLAMILWDDAEKNARPYDEDFGAGFRSRMDMCDDAFRKARLAIAKAVGE